MSLKPDGDCHDLQARTGRRAQLAPSRRPQPIAKGGHWDKVHRRHPRRQPTATSRLTPSSPRFGYSSTARAIKPSARLATKRTYGSIDFRGNYYRPCELSPTHDTRGAKTESETGRLVGGAVSRRP